MSSILEDDIQFHEEEEWIAVYRNGKLVTVGDAYYAHEWLMEQVGVKVVQDAAFMRGQTDRDGVAQTLAEVDEYRQEKDAANREVAELRAKLAAAEAELAGR